ncbi:NAD(P)-dependent oxidoreductase [Phycisphaeraceae bacterium D3-23]
MTASTDTPTLGYIGLGIMGEPMARNLMRAGYPLVVYNRTASKGDALVADGAQRAESPAEVARQVGAGGFVFINVTDTPDVEHVLFSDKHGLIHGAAEGLVVVDHSTIAPIATQGFAQRLAERGVTLIDAPVSGGDVGAQQGTLSIMCGGDEVAFDRVRPMLDVVGKSVVRLGGPGMGQACKACNQVAVVNALVGVCEAAALAKKVGLDVEKMIEVVAGGAGGSWQISNLGPKIAQGDHDPGFMVDLVLKDLGIVQDTAQRVGLPIAGTATAQGYFRSVAAQGGGRLGTQAMAKALEALADFSFTDPDGPPGDASP